jgi:hemerythrin-like domain-containing protein
MPDERDGSRRGFLRLAGATAFLVTLRGKGTVAEEKPESAGGKEEIPVSPAEDLMREHGVLDRVLLIYEEAVRRLNGKKELDPGLLIGSAGIVRRFIEDYHEKLEENDLFPRFEKAHTLTDLVGVLRRQHEAGRRLTDRIRNLATAAALKAPAERGQLAEALRLFIRMYRPHAAREDTVLFPALRRIVSPHEYDALGEDFEEREHRLFGKGGFESVVDEVARIEQQLGIGDLGLFTPPR